MIVLRREERVEDMAHIASTNSTSVVSDGCQNAPALYGSFDMNRSRTALRIADGIFRVNDQVQKYLLDLMGISPRARQIFRELGCDENVLNIFLILAELDHISDDFVQIEQNPCRFGFGSKAEEILNDLTSTFGLRKDHFNHPSRAGIQLRTGHELGVSKNARQWVVQLMGNPRNHPSDRGHLFKVNHLAAKLDFICDLGGICDLQAVFIQRHSLQFVCSPSWGLEFVLRQRQDIPSVWEKIVKRRIRKNDPAVAINNRNRNGDQSE